jgi:hypothetical protein
MSGEAKPVLCKDLSVWGFTNRRADGNDMETIENITKEPRKIDMKIISNSKENSRTFRENVLKPNSELSLSLYIDRKAGVF